MTDLKNWKIIPETLQGYKVDTWNEDYFEEIDGKQYAVLIYNIDEIRMGDYYGYLAIYKNPVYPTLVLSSKRNWINFSGRETFVYIKSADCFIFRMAAYVEGSSKGDMPFLFISPSKRLYAFIEWNNMSVYHSFNEIDEESVQSYELQPKHLINYSGPRKAGEIIYFRDLQWFSFDYFDEALSVYHN